MARFTFAVASFALLAGTVAADDPPKKATTAAEELQRLQGTWQIEAWEEGGKALAAADIKKRGVFFGANVFFFNRDGKPHQVGTVQLDPGKSPATANLSVRRGEGKDGVMLGIYSIEGGTLTLCFDPTGQARPKNFKPDPKDGFALVTLKKPKPAVEETVDIVGKYRSELVDGVTGKTNVAEVTVEKRGDGYTLTYRIDDQVAYIGTALRKGDQLSMGWISGGQIGVSVYKIEAGPKLVGEYTILGGVGMTVKETLTPWKKTD
ncbi:MAG: TIGR03067 domain-containing protein [Planctomycetes bacterium]|nr:TIGR03067 domain-containing protein [Planctomycetota bacterium]